MDGPKIEAIPNGVRVALPSIRRMESVVRFALDGAAIFAVDQLINHRPLTRSVIYAAVGAAAWMALRPVFRPRRVSFVREGDWLIVSTIGLFRRQYRYPWDKLTFKIIRPPFILNPTGRAYLRVTCEGFRAANVLGGYKASDCVTVIMHARAGRRE